MRKKCFGFLVFLAFAVLLSGALGEGMDASVIPDMTGPAYVLDMGEWEITAVGVSGDFITPESAAYYTQDGNSPFTCPLAYDAGMGGVKMDEGSPYFQMDGFTGNMAYSQIYVSNMLTENSQYAVVFPYKPDNYEGSAEYRGAIMLWMMEDRDAGVYCLAARCENDGCILFETIGRGGEVLSAALVLNGEILQDSAEESALYAYLQQADRITDEGKHLWPDILCFNGPIPEKGD